MSISQEWTRMIRDVRGVFLAIRNSMGFEWVGKGGEMSKPRPVLVATVQSTLVVDRRVLAELERRKNLALLNNTRSLVR